MKKTDRRRLREQVKEFLALGNAESVGVAWGYADLSPYDYRARTFRGHQIHRIEYRPVYIDRVHGHCASGGIIYKGNPNRAVTTKIVYVPGAYGFGESAREAWQDARDRAWRRMPLEFRIERVKEKYPDLSCTATWQEWGDVHAMLTGSCEKGRQEWINRHGPDVRVTMREFLRATESDYGNEKIKKLREAYEN